MRVQVERTFPAPAADVFAHFSTPESYADAHRRCQAIRYHIDSGVTAVTEEEWTYAGRTYRLSHRVQLEPPRAVRLEMLAGPGRGARESVHIEPARAGTRVRYAVAFRLPAALRPLEPVIASRLRSFVEDLADEDWAAIHERLRQPSR